MQKEYGYGLVPNYRLDLVAVTWGAVKSKYFAYNLFAHFPQGNKCGSHVVKDSRNFVTILHFILILTRKVASENNPWLLIKELCFGLIIPYSIRSLALQPSFNE